MGAPIILEKNYNSHSTEHGTEDRRTRSASFEIGYRVEYTEDLSVTHMAMETPRVCHYHHKQEKHKHGD